MGKPRQRAVDILGLQPQSGRCGSRAAGRTGKASIADGGRPTAAGGAARFPIFAEAFDFVREVGELAETEGHHPHTSFGWRHATVSLSTEQIEGWQRTVAPSQCSAEPAFSAAASYGIFALADFVFGSRQGIPIGGTDCLVLMICNFNP
ncbi:MAG: 4a-hydroxytetrahydrobiopterin dehydratase [Xanthobacteraceae bacterium]